MLREFVLLDKLTGTLKCVGFNLEFEEVCLDMTSGSSGSGMVDDSLAELLNHLSGTSRDSRSSSSRPSQPSSAGHSWNNHQAATHSKKEKTKNVRLV